MADQNKSLPPLYMQDEKGVLHPVDPGELEVLQKNAGNGHPVVHVSRAMEPQPPVISEETRRKHEESKQRYVELNLSDGEYVILAIKRHPIGLFPIWGIVGLLALLTFFALPLYAINKDSLSGFFLVPEAMPSSAAVGLFLLALLGLFVTGGIIATYVYLGNKFFLTNESVIQIIRPSLFSTHEQTVSLSNIEDASYRQRGIIQSLFNYGSLRLSTEGDETTYRFNYVANPRSQVATLNNAVEAFKNGRPVVND
jgi:uncharacterized membrane protein YdbT with pleckstrin-like domain